MGKIEDTSNYDDDVTPEAIDQLRCEAAGIISKGRWVVVDGYVGKDNVNVAEGESRAFPRAGTRPRKREPALVVTKQPDVTR